MMLAPEFILPVDFSCSDDHDSSSYIAEAGDVAQMPLVQMCKYEVIMISDNVLLAGALLMMTLSPAYASTDTNDLGLSNAFAIYRRFMP